MWNKITNLLKDYKHNEKYLHEFKNIPQNIQETVDLSYCCNRSIDQSLIEQLKQYFDNKDKKDTISKKPIIEIIFNEFNWLK